MWLEGSAIHLLSNSYLSPISRAPGFSSWVKHLLRLWNKPCGNCPVCTVLISSRKYKGCLFFFFFFSLTQRPLLLTSLEYWCQNHPSQFQLHLNPFKQLQGPLKAGSRVPFPQASVSSRKSSPHAGLSGRVWSELNLVKEEFSLPQPPVGIHKSTSPPFPAPPKWAWEQPSISTASDSRKGDCEGIDYLHSLKKK